MNSERPKMDFVGIRVEPELRAMIEQAATEQQRPVSNFLRVMIKEYFAVTNGQPRAAA